MAKIKLFCFPFAGGSAIFFHKWKQLINDTIEIRPVELAGRGKRISEPLYKDVPEVIEDVFDIIKDEIKNSSPYALLGHSMGSMIAYELAQKIRKENLPPPMHIFFSGRGAPYIKKEDEKIYHLLSEEEFNKEIIELGGTPPEFFEHPELMELFLPVIKNDFKLAESLFDHIEIKPLDCNITVLLGKDDDQSPEQSDGWKKHTTKICSIHYFEGGHFFISDETDQIIKIINNNLLGYL